MCTIEHDGDRFAQPDVAVINGPTPALFFGRGLPEQFCCRPPFFLHHEFKAFVPHEAGGLEKPFLIATNEVLLGVVPNVVVAKRQGVAEVQLALKQRVFKQLVNVHVKTTQMPPPFAVVQPRMGLGNVPQSLKIVQHAVASRAITELPSLPQVPSRVQRLKQLRRFRASLLLLP